MKEILKKIRKLSDPHNFKLKLTSQEDCSKDLNEKELKHLMTATSLEEKEILSKYQVFLKDHPTGQISKETFDKILKKCFDKSSRKQLKYVLN